MEYLYTLILLGVFQVEQEEWGRVQTLYERLLERTHHVKVWISYARCQHAMPPQEEGPVRARGVFQRANRALRSCQEKEQRLMLLEAWRDYEDEFGDDISLEKVKQLLPRKVTRRRQVAADDGSKMRWEEYVDFVFPDDETAKPSLLLLAKAKEWVKKKQQQEQEQEQEQEQREEPRTPPLEDNTAESQPHSDQTSRQEEEPERDLDRDDSDVDVGSSSDSSSSSDDSEEDDKKKTKRKRRRRRSTSSSSSSSSDEDEEKKSSEEGKRKERKQPRINTPPRSSSEEREADSEDRRKKAKDFFT